MCPATNTLHVKDEDKAEILNKQYESVFTSIHVSENELQNFRDPLTGLSLANHVFTDDEILKVLAACKRSSACGPDGIPSCFLKDVRLSITRPLLLLFQLSLETGKLPNEWLSCHPL